MAPLPHSASDMSIQTIWLHAAPAKPQEGEPCNGCGVCCASAPCPLGVLFSFRTTGRCARLRSDEASRHYRCGLLPAADSPAAHWLQRNRERLTARLVRRWIGAGIGCDSSATVAGGLGGTGTEG
jgi:hypothetical protein